MLLRNETSFELCSPRSLRAITLLRSSFLNLSSSFDAVIVHAHLTWPFYYCAVASFGIKNLTLVYTEHNTTNKRRSIPPLRIIDRLVYSMYSKIVSISHPTRTYLLNWLNLPDTGVNKEKFLVILNGSRTFRDRFFRKDFVIKPLNVISIGSLTYKKGFDNAILAVDKVRDYIGKYIILGDGPMRPSLQKLINKLDLQDRIKLVGFVDQVDDFLDDIDLGLVSSRVEGFGLCAIELLSAGIPVVCTNIPGISDILSNSSAVYLTEGSNSQAIADGILYGYANLAFRPGISSLAVDYSDKYSIQQMLDNYQSLYFQLI